jgi:Secretory lipase
MLRHIAAITAVAAALALGWMSLTAGPARAAGAIPPPDGDPFYQAPNPLPAVPAGTVLRSRPVTVAALGLPVPVQAWQLLYTSTDTAGRPVADVTTLLLPAGPSPLPARPLLSYQVAEDSLTMSCAPSFQLRTGVETEEPTIAGALGNGWAVAVPDYEGLQSQFGAGTQAGHAVLDGVRAALSFGPAGLSGAATPVGLWGYSGGGLASAWAAELQPGYAPRLPIAGVAAGGVPPHLGHIAARINGGPFAGLYLAAAIGLARAYPQLIDLDHLLNARGKAAEAIISNECVEQYTPQFAFQDVNQLTTVGDPLLLPQVQQAIAADALGQRRPSGPLFVYQAINDEIIPFADARALVGTYCAQGVPVTFDQDPLSGHVSLAGTGAPLAVGYLSARFAGQSPPSTC